ncbi:hypothetical protein [Thermoflexibacter ruber]|nr:hypothetical protein [Thermoflexibacter ruber]
MKNKEWIFSGIGVFLLGLFLTFISKRFKKQKAEKKIVDNTQRQDIPLTNNIKAEKVNLHQTIISNSKTGDIHSSDTDNSVGVKTNNPQLLKIKDEYFSDKNELKVFLFKKLAEARNINVKLEVRHITDAAEDELQIKHDKAISEIEKLEEEGIIRFEKEKDEVLSPYTRIRLTEKYFAAIK